jgi:hypothetical protein
MIAQLGCSVTVEAETISILADIFHVAQYSVPICCARVLFVFCMRMAVVGFGVLGATSVFRSELRCLGQRRLRSSGRSRGHVAVTGRVPFPATALRHVTV